MNVGVIGGSGFIGRHLTLALLESGHDVTVYDPLAPPSPAAVRWVAGGGPTQAHDAVVMLAAMADVVEVNRDPVGSVDRNVLLPARVFADSVAHGVQRFLFASTIWVYDSVRDQSESGVADVTTPVNAYSAGKLCAEVMLRSMERHFDSRTRLTVMRFGIPYGPGMRRHAVIPAFVERMLAGEELVVNGSLQVGRPFLHVRDLARGIVRLLDAPPGTYNVSGERLVTLREIIDEIAAVFGREPAVRVENERAIDTGARSPGIDAMRALGWRPEVPLRDGIAEMVDELSGVPVG